MSFIDDHRGKYGVESICSQLPIAPSVYYEQKARQAKPERVPPRVRRDIAMAVQIQRVYAENFKVYGARKVWLELGREDLDIACMNPNGCSQRFETAQVKIDRPVSDNAPTR